MSVKKTPVSKVPAFMARVGGNLKDGWVISITPLEDDLNQIRRHALFSLSDGVTEQIKQTMWPIPCIFGRFKPGDVISISARYAHIHKSSKPIRLHIPGSAQRIVDADPPVTADISPAVQEFSDFLCNMHPEWSVDDRQYCRQLVDRFCAAISAQTVERMLQEVIRCNADHNNDEKEI